MAFVRIVVQQLDPARMDEVNAFGDTVRAALQTAPGLQRWMAAGDPDTGRAVTVSVWETREQAEVGIAAVLPDIQQQMASRGNQLLSTHVYPVNAEVVPQVPA